MTEPSRLTAHATNADHVAEGLALLTSQLKGKPVIAALLTSWLDQAQELEDAIWELYGLAIDTSSDDALDQIGVIFRQPRSVGLADAPYRKVLRACVIARKSEGVGDDLIRVMAALVGSNAFTMTEAFPASVVLEPDAATGVPIELMRAVLARTKSGGVGLAVVDVPSGNAFTFSSSMFRSEVDADHGFSDTTQVAGGVLVGVM